MFIQEQKLRLLKCSHKKCNCLPLPAGKKTDLCGHTVFKAKIQLSQSIAVNFPFLGGYAPAQASFLGPSVSHCQVFFYHHCRCSTHHRILKYAADVTGSVCLALISNVLPVEKNSAAVHLMNSGNGVQHC